MDTRIVNHRRTRQQTRRVLAEMVVRGRDLTESNSLWDYDFLDHQSRMRVFPQHSTFARNSR